MKQLKNLQYIFVFLIILLVLVLVRSFNPNLFKQDPGKAVDAAQNNSNSITLAQLKALRTKYLVINLGNGDKFDSIKMKNSLNIPIENLLDKANLTIFKESKDEIILYSSDESTTAKAWVILNQLGFKKLFILAPEENPEAFIYIFQPDTTARLENDSI
ncbi:MAG TPA: rhodanese-like domain-containing protein [Prolixibacteraceae bacterium]|nr:rhodanese-like domain-containing protein [Prolixibacteraceae bacterium]